MDLFIIIMLYSGRFREIQGDSASSDYFFTSGPFQGSQLVLG